MLLSRKQNLAITIIV